MKITVISKDDKHLMEIARLLHERSPSDDIDVASGTLDKLSGLTELTAPDVLVLAQPHIEEDDLNRLEHFGNVHPNMATILICNQQSPEFFLQAMRVGVREVLPSPVGAASLFPAIRRIADKFESRSLSHGKILAFISCKGGSGATFIATNLGYALATLENKRVALIDLNLQFGDASLFVSDHKPMATLADVARQIHRLDPSFLTSSMISVAPNFGVLAAPEDPSHANDIKPEHIDALLKLARRQYDFVLLDIGRNLDAVSVRALDQTDMIFPILQATLPYIRDGKRLLGVFQSLDYRKDKIHVIVNRHEKADEIRLKDLESAYGTEVYMTIPNHFSAAAASVNQGVPVLKLVPNSTISTALQKFAKSLVGLSNTASAPEARSWLSRLLQKN